MLPYIIWVRVVNLPNYSGDNVIEILERGIRVMEQLFRVWDIPYDLRMDIAIGFLTRKAT